MSKIVIATAPCSWGVWYADGTPSGTPYPTFLDQAAASGYRGLELGPDGYLPTDSARLREELTARNLRVCAGTACYAFNTVSSFEALRPRVEALCRRLREFDARYLVTMDESDVGECSRKKAGFGPEVTRRFLEVVGEMGRYTAGEFGIQVVYHPHIKTMVETESEICRLMDATGLDLCLDTGHHAYVNGSCEQGDPCVTDFIRAYREKIAYLHFKNVDTAVYRSVMAQGLDSDVAFDRDVMCDLAKGCLDFPALQRTLDEIGFAGIAVIEQDMPRATTQEAFAAARRNLEYLRSIHMID